MFILNPYRYANSLIYTTFDGTNEDIDCGGDSSISFERTNAFSIVAWIYIDTLTSIRGIIGKDAIGSGGLNRGYFVNVQTNGKLSTQLRNSATDRIRADSTNTISTGSWNHIAMTYDGSSTLAGVNLYINGSSETKTNTTDNLTATIVNSSNLAIGNNTTIGTNLYFDGAIDKVIVYNAELTSGNITTIYNYGRKAGLIGIGNEVSQWELDTLNPSDIIGSNNGTSNNMDASNIVVG